MRPTLPLVSRKAMSFSPSSITRTGSESGDGTSDESMAGTQYWRIRSPIGEPGPTRVTSSLSSLLSMRAPQVALDAVIVLRSGRFGDSAPRRDDRPARDTAAPSETPLREETTAPRGTPLRKVRYRSDGRLRQSVGRWVWRQH